MNKWCNRFGCWCNDVLEVIELEYPCEMDCAICEDYEEVE